MMDKDLLALLRASKLFSSLPSRAIKKILPTLEKVTLNKNQILYYQGDPSDSIDIILSGQLESTLTTVNGEKKAINEFGPGETVGEMGALSDNPRTTTIKALKDSVVLKLPREIFIALCRQYPSVLFDVLSPIVSQSSKILQTLSSEKFKKHIAFLSINEQITLDLFSEKLKEAIPRSLNILILSDFETHFDALSFQEIEEKINEAKMKKAKKIKQRVLYMLKNTETPLAQFYFSKADMLYLVGSPESSPTLNASAETAIQQFKKNSKIKPELILLHPDGKTLPTQTAQWLALTEFGLHHHIRMDEDSDFRRLIRFIRNKAVGLVLGGGGTRGWGHAGAIQALKEAGIPIDLIGGTSVGAIVAASYALSESSQGTLQHFQEVIEGSRHSVSWRSLTWPAISLFSAKGFTHTLQKIFGDIQIEDLWVPFFCVSTHLEKNTEAIHRKGLLWEKLRCSASIPGIIPPVLINNELHVDGGLLNNLPVDVMRQIVSARGTIIAVELNTSLREEHHYHFPPVLPFWQTFLSQLGIKYHYVFPPFVDTFLKSLLAGSSLKSQQNSLAANILVSMDLSKFGMLYFNKSQEKSIVTIGYETTVHQIKKLHHP